MKYFSCYKDRIGGGIVWQFDVNYALPKRVILNFSLNSTQAGEYPCPWWVQADFFLTNLQFSLIFRALAMPEIWRIGLVIAMCSQFGNTFNA